MRVLGFRYLVLHHPRNPPKLLPPAYYIAARFPPIFVYFNVCLD